MREDYRVSNGSSSKSRKERHRFHSIGGTRTHLSSTALQTHLSNSLKAVRSKAKERGDFSTRSA